MIDLGGPFVVFWELEIQRVSHVWKSLPLAIVLLISEIIYVLMD
jgi:hypothetical protein